MRDVDTKKTADTVEEAVKEPHRATRFRDGIYPAVGTVLGIGILILIALFFIL